MKKVVVFSFVFCMFFSCTEPSIDNQESKSKIDQNDKAIEELDNKMNESNQRIQDALKNIEEKIESKKERGFEKFEMDSTMKDANIKVEEYKQ